MSKTVLITGASRGIGAACAEAFAKEGFDVVINFHSSRKAAEQLSEKLSASYGVRTLCVCADVSKKADCDEMVKKAIQEFGFIDVLVNNAGISLSKLFTDTQEDEWERVIGTNLSSVYYCSKAVLPSMIREHRGVIVNIASMWGEAGASCEAAYSASKAGVIGLTKALAKEVGPSHIRVNAVSPGVVMTDMMKEYDEETIASLKEETPLGILGAPEDIARAAVFLSSEQARFITGQVLSVNGGFLI